MFASRGPARGFPACTGARTPPASTGPLRRAGTTRGAASGRSHASRATGAWPFVVDLVTAETTEKELLLAAIHAVGSIRPEEAPAVLGHLDVYGDPDIDEAVLEATSAKPGEEEDEDDEDLFDDEDPGLLN